MTRVNWTPPQNFVDRRRKALSLESYNFDPVETAYKLDKLLCRALEEEVLSSAFVEEHKLVGKTFTSVRSEIEYMKGPEGLFASSTLLVEGIPIPTYKPYGMLFDARLCVIKGAYHSDCNSCKDDRGLPLIPDKGKRTLYQLAEEIKKSDSQQMNEVFAKLDQPIGLYARFGNSSAYIEVMMVKDYLKKRFNLNLPVYLYNQAKGLIFKVENSKRERQKEAKKFSTLSSGCRAMARAFERTFVTQASVGA